MQMQTWHSVIGIKGLPRRIGTIWPTSKEHSIVLTMWATTGNNYRIVTVVIFIHKRVYMRFVGTQEEYDRIKDIKNI